MKIKNLNDIRCWSKDILIKFIKIYRKHPALWNIKSEEYKNRTLKNKGYDELLRFYKQYESEADRAVVARKIQSLRGSFRKELKKVKKSQRSGMSADKMYKPSLWYYDMLSFTIEHEESTHDSIDNVTEEILSSSEKNRNEQYEEKKIKIMQASQENVSAPENTNKQPKRKQMDKDQPELFNTCTEALKSTEKTDEYDALGSYIAKRLKKIQNIEQRVLAEGFLMEVMQRATLGKLSQSTVLGEAVSENAAPISAPTPTVLQDFSEESSNF